MILRCLRKDPERRFQHIDDVKVALQEIKDESESGTTAAVARPRIRPAPLIAAIAGTLILITVIVGWLLRSPGGAAAPPMRVTPLTVLPGHEQWPTFSPDGTQVAFEWDGEHSENSDIYTKLVDSSEVRRLTTDAARDGAPSWSPDGRQVAYIRFDPGSEGNIGTAIHAAPAATGLASWNAPGRIHLVSPLVGSDRKLNDVRVWAPLAWSPDGRYLAAGSPKGIYLIPLDGREPRVLIASKQEGILAPAFSPDGRRLAYVSYR